MRFTNAVEAVAMTDVFELCKLLAVSVQEAMKEGVFPHMDPACKLIAHHIAFAVNGDVPFHDHWQETYQYCVYRANKESTGIPTEQQGEIKDGPTHQAS